MAWSRGMHTVLGRMPPMPAVLMRARAPASHDSARHTAGKALTSRSSMSSRHASMAGPCSLAEAAGSPVSTSPRRKMPPFLMLLHTCTSSTVPEPATRPCCHSSSTDGRQNLGCTRVVSVRRYLRTWWYTRACFTSPQATAGDEYMIHANTTMVMVTDTEALVTSHMNMSARDRMAPSAAVCQVNHLKWGRKLGAPDTRRSMHARLVKAYVRRKKLEMMAAMAFRLPMSRQACAMPHVRMSARMGSSSAPWPTAKGERQLMRLSRASACMMRAPPMSELSPEESVLAQMPATMGQGE
mmetsp:Transcript_12877/g.43553  ORF Transcript_12877/g.43553 Transcript_12877/m.43553 type:complete len:297 (+) Transcript_12877:1000-1890(+)